MILARVVRMLQTILAIVFKPLFIQQDGLFAFWVRANFAPALGAFSVLSEPLVPGAVQTIGGTGTTQKIFQSNTLYQSGPNQGKPIPFTGTITDFLLPIPGGNKVNGTAFRVRMSGNVFVHGTSPTFQLQLLGTLGSTPGTNVILCQSSAVSLTTAANYDWTLEATLFGSNAPAVTTVPGGAGALTGQFSSNIGGTVAASGTLTNALTSVKFGPTDGSPACYLKAAALFGVSDALNLASLTEFYAWVEEL